METISPFKLPIAAVGPGCIIRRSSNINVTERFLHEFGHDQTGLRELFQHTINDVPDPLHPGQPISYGQLHSEMNTPTGEARAEAYARANNINARLEPESYTEMQFDAARCRLLARAFKYPDTLIFAPEAVEAFVASRCLSSKG